MSKFHKLTKSNEIFTYTFSQQMESLKDSIYDYIMKLTINISSVILSAIISFTINLPNKSSDNKFIIAIKIIFWFLIFLAIIRVILCIIQHIKKLDNKNNTKNIVILRDFFYTKVLNHILMALSICNTLKDLEEGSDNDYLTKIYLYEAFYYFKIANEEMSEKNFIEISNPKREKYTEFLKEMDSVFLIEVFNICIEKLNYIKNKALEFNNNVLQQDTDNIIRIFNNYIENIEEQVNRE